MSDFNPKKAINEAIVNKINKDEDFKEFYATLSVKEKENLKERYLSFHEFDSLICEHQKYSPESLQKVAEELFEKEIKGRGYKKVQGKKARAYVKNRKFVYKWGDYWIGMCPKEVSKKGYMCLWMFMMEIPTEKGRIFVDLPGVGLEDQKTTHVVYTAHFFDRYQERLGIEGNRNDTIMGFIKHELNKERATGIDKDFDGNSIYDLNQGLALGKDLGKMILNKTFISKDEINSYQQRKKEELAILVKEKL